jgi:hypothetical protein
MTKDSKQPSERKIASASARIPWWVAIIVMLGALLTIGGAVISKMDPTVLTNSSPMTGAAWVYADYVFSRNLALGLMVLLLLAIRAKRMLAGFMVLIALIQLIDLLGDIASGDFSLAAGLLVFTIVFLLGAWQLFGQPLWHREAWRDQEGHP